MTLPASVGKGKKRFEHNQPHVVTQDALTRIPTERKWRDADQQLEKITADQRDGIEQV